VSGTIDQKTYLKKFKGGFSPLASWIRLWPIRGVTREWQRETQFPGRRITGELRKVPTMSQVLSLIQHICFRETLSSNMGSTNFSLPLAPSNLGTALAPIYIKAPCAFSFHALGCFRSCSLRLVCCNEPNNLVCQTIKMWWLPKVWWISPLKADILQHLVYCWSANLFQHF